MEGFVLLCIIPSVCTNHNMMGYLFNIVLQQRRKERGRIDIGSVQVVETAQLSGIGGGGVGGGDTGSNNSLILEGPGYPFQVGYQEGGQEYTLYLLANREQDRAEWINALRAGNLSPHSLKLKLILMSVKYEEITLQYSFDQICVGACMFHKMCTGT